MDSSEDNDSSLSPGPEIISDFDQFLRENQHLFTLIGVFGTISVYLSNIECEQPSDEIPLGDIAIFSGFGIALMLSSIIIYKIISITIVDEDSTFKIEKVPFLLFGFLFFWFISVIFTLLTDYENAAAGILIAITIMVGMILPIILLSKLDEYGVFDWLPVRKTVSILLYSIILTILLFNTEEYISANYISYQGPPNNGGSIPQQFYPTLAQSFVGSAMITSAGMFLIYSLILLFKVIAHTCRKGVEQLKEAIYME